MELDLKVENNVIVMTHSGPVDREFASQLYEQVQQLSSETGIKKVLIDVRNSPTALKTMERYEMAKEIAEKMKGFKIASVQTEPLYHPKKLGETVAATRGLDIRVFLDLDEAWEWLGVPGGSGRDGEDDR
ncbi:MAG: hypothetical protein R3318_00485 [Gammaproteobacteria bacterium]|nr:hypothetical protein [Gammaproteobacteria bacterium]